jgi:DNA-directed RNA polymerase subunit RPC12/RpoP
MTEQERKHRQRMVDYSLRSNTQVYSCPVCQDDVRVADNTHWITCTGCGSRLEVDRDAQFEGGMWHDLTKLISKK